MAWYYLFALTILAASLMGNTSATSTSSEKGWPVEPLPPSTPSLSSPAFLQCVYFNRDICHEQNNCTCRESVEVCPTDRGPQHCFAALTLTETDKEVLMKGCQANTPHGPCAVVGGKHGECTPQQTGEEYHCCCPGTNFCNGKGMNKTSSLVTLLTVANGTADVCTEHNSCHAIGCGATSDSDCQCDSLCQFFDDCCYDYQSICRDEPVAQQFAGLERGNFTCVDKGYWLVTSCPHSFKNEDILMKCQDQAQDDILAQIPVTDNTGIPYRNVHCAVCHGVNASTLTAWSGQTMCDLNILQRMVRGLKNNTPTNVKLAIIALTCPLTFQPPDLSSHFPKPRSCFPDLTGICQLKNLQSIFGTGCRSYTAVVKVGNKPYKNPHCFSCSYDLSLVPDGINCTNRQDIPFYKMRYTVFVKPATKPSLRGRFVPLSVLMDFGSDKTMRIMQEETVLHEETITCPDGQVYNPSLAMCQKLICPDGYRLVNRECQEDIDYAQTADMQCNYTQLQMVLHMKIIVQQSHNCHSNVRRAELIQCIDNMIANALNSSCDYWESYQPVYVQCLEENTETPFKLLELTFCIYPGSSDHISMLHFLGSHNLTDMMAACPLYTLKLSHPNMNNCSYKTLRANNFLFKNVNGTPFIQVHNSSSQYNAYKSNILSEYKLNESSGTFDRMITLKFCLEASADSMSCPLVALNQSLFRQVDNRSETLQYLPTGDIYNRSKYMSQDDGTILVCSTLKHTYTKFRNVTFFSYSKIQTILSTTGTLLSVVACVITLITYCMFPILRNRAGSKSIMNLVATLFIAQLLLLVSGQATIIPQLCAAVAAMAHYFWLAAFCWMNVLSLDLCYTFGTHAKLQRSISDTTIFVLYMLYAWGLPMLVILPCIAAHLCKCTGLQYGNEYVCWITDGASMEESNGQTNLLAFGLPLALLILVNIVLYIKTVAGIRETKKATSRMQVTIGELSETKRTVKELLIYIKIGSLMGFAWLFSFAAAFSHVESLWYIVIILNSLQGVFIFMSFTINSRVWNLWKKKLMGETKKERGIINRKGTQSTDLAGPQSTSLLGNKANVVQDQLDVAGTQSTSLLGYKANVPQEKLECQSRGLTSRETQI